MALNVNHWKEKETCFAFCAFVIQQKDILLCRICYNFPMSNGKLLKYMKNYLAMEEWFHNNNGKDKVRSARNNIALVLRSVQRFFPRSEKTNSYNIPKMHGMTKMQEYMKLFVSGMNFYGGSGEAAHGQKTQRRVSEFAKQTANQHYYN
jgi:hypothetical protein